MSIYKEIYSVAQDCGYNGLTPNQAFEFICDSFPELCKSFSVEDWDNLEDAYTIGRADFLLESDTLMAGNC